MARTNIYIGNLTKKDLKSFFVKLWLNKINLKGEKNKTTAYGSFFPKTISFLFHLICKKIIAKGQFYYDKCSCSMNYYANLLIQQTWVWYQDMQSFYKLRLSVSQNVGIVFN